MLDSWVQSVEVFKKPDTGDAVNGCDIKSRFCNVVFVKLIQLFFYLLLIEKSIFFVVPDIVNLNAWHFCKGIILIEFEFIQQQIHLFAAIAAKCAVISDDRCFPAIGTTMYACLFS